MWRNGERGGAFNEKGRPQGAPDAVAHGTLPVYATMAGAVPTNQPLELVPGPEIWRGKALSSS